MSRIAVVLIILSLAACGRRGPLELPPGPPPTPLLGTTKPAPSPNTPSAKVGADVSTLTQTQKP
ncbi:MAG: lipoprotein [Rhodocyclales bacterium]|nr:lipoprotein [Rhodocyclales bacterium]